MQLGDRMKEYEKQDQTGRLMPLLPAFARLDGKAFHTFTKGLDKPFDQGMCDLMRDTTKYLVQATNARIGYTQSDEITLMWYSEDSTSQIYFDGRISKMLSVLAAQCSVYFNEKLAEYLPEKYLLVSATGDYPVFDCRVWTVPTKAEATNVLLWRELDAIRNSKQSAGHKYFSHKELHQRNTQKIVEMLEKKGIIWGDYPDFFKRGTYVQRKTVKRPFTRQEIAKLPENHHALANPDLEVTRRDYVYVDMPPFQQIQNRVGVVFNGEKPVVNPIFVETGNV